MSRINLLEFDSKAKFNEGRWLKAEFPGVPDFDFEIHILSRQSDAFLAAMRANNEEQKKAGAPAQNSPEADERNNFNMTCMLTQGWRGADAPGDFDADKLRTIYTKHPHILRQVQSAVMDDAGFLAPPSSSSSTTPAASSSSTSEEKTAAPSASI